MLEPKLLSQVFLGKAHIGLNHVKVIKGVGIGDKKWLKS
ncbi:unannotated protein [freshwater metagenome]|jgi:hypothetical protein|uniref:Unannotated protein n=1 Tax=freshwater metagenome TaxID=449393 RepID=A0A6J7K7Z6_9ZZZZ